MQMDSPPLAVPCTRCRRLDPDVGELRRVGEGDWPSRPASLESVALGEGNKKTPILGILARGGQPLGAFVSGRVAGEEGFKGFSFRTHEICC